MVVEIVVAGKAALLEVIVEAGGAGEPLKLGENLGIRQRFSCKGGRGKDGLKLRDTPLAEEESSPRYW